MKQLNYKTISVGISVQIKHVFSQFSQTIEEQMKLSNNIINTILFMRFPFKVFVRYNIGYIVLVNTYDIYINLAE